MRPSRAASREPTCTMGDVRILSGPAGEPGAPPAGGVRGTTSPPWGSLGRLDVLRCSVQARARWDSGGASASPALRWLLIEQPGPWGREALLESPFDQEVAPQLAARARHESVRVLMVRRPGNPRADAGRRWAYADGRPGHERLWWSTRVSDAE